MRKLQKENVVGIVRWAGVIEIRPLSREDELLYDYFLSGETTPAGLFKDFGFEGCTKIRARNADLQSVSYALEGVYNRKGA